MFKILCPKQESKHIVYLDTNSLYGYAIAKFLPTGIFKWTEFGSNKCSSDISKGWFLKVDIKCLKELRELHNDYPLVPDKIEIKKKCLIMN